MAVPPRKQEPTAATILLVFVNVIPMPKTRKIPPEPTGRPPWDRDKKKSPPRRVGTWIKPPESMYYPIPLMVDADGQNVSDADYLYIQRLVQPLLFLIAVVLPLLKETFKHRIGNRVILMIVFQSRVAGLGVLILEVELLWLVLMDGKGVGKGGVP